MRACVSSVKLVGETANVREYFFDYFLNVWLFVGTCVCVCVDIYVFVINMYVLSVCVFC